MPTITTSTGEIVALEERICEGGCGLRFSCLPSSPQRRARSGCAEFCSKKFKAGAAAIAPLPLTARKAPPTESEQQIFDTVIERVEALIAQRAKVSFAQEALAIGMTVGQWSQLKIKVDKYDPDRRRRYEVANQSIRAHKLRAKPKKDHRPSAPGGRDQTTVEVKKTPQIEAAFQRILAESTVSTVAEPKPGAIALESTTRPTAVDVLVEVLSLIALLSETDRERVLRSVSSFFDPPSER